MVGSEGYRGERRGHANAERLFGDRVSLRRQVNDGGMMHHDRCKKSVASGAGVAIGWTISMWRASFFAKFDAQ